MTRGSGRRGELDINELIMCEPFCQKLDAAFLNVLYCAMFTFKDFCYA